MCYLFLGGNSVARFSRRRCPGIRLVAGRCCRAETNPSGTSARVACALQKPGAPDHGRQVADTKRYKHKMSWHRSRCSAQACLRPVSFALQPTNIKATRCGPARPPNSTHDGPPPGHTGCFSPAVLGWKKRHRFPARPARPISGSPGKTDFRLAWRDRFPIRLANVISSSSGETADSLLAD